MIFIVESISLEENCHALVIKHLTSENTHRIVARTKRSGLASAQTLTSPTQPNPITVTREESTMPDNPNTSENESAPVDAEAWEIAFKPYAEHQHARSAYDLARKLMAVKQCLLTQPPEVSLAATTLEGACDALFPLSEFYKAGYDLFRLAIEGRATRADENLMDGLGIRN
jgi:hypothetical protein